MSTFTRTVGALMVAVLLMFSTFGVSSRATLDDVHHVLHEGTEQVEHHHHHGHHGRGH